MPIANVNGVDLNYEVVGEGRAVVFLHGYTGNVNDWASQVSVLSSKYKVVTLEHRGHGKSAAPSLKEAYSIPIFASDVFELLKKLNIAKCWLVGHSLGGFIALEFALRYQDMLAAMVLVDTSSGFSSDPGYAPFRRKLDELARSRGMGAAFDYNSANDPVRKERFENHPEQKEIARQKMLMTSVDGYVYVWQASEEWEPITDRLAEIGVPTLVYWGSEDAMFLDACRNLKENIAGAELVVVEGSGHAPHEEMPTVFNNRLLEFLDRIKW
ncbi:alpha/beta fold hydrolase [Chloroflexota bacterium]